MSHDITCKNNSHLLIKKIYPTKKGGENNTSFNINDSIYKLNNILNDLCSFEVNIYKDGMLETKFYDEYNVTTKQCKTYTSIMKELLKYQPKESTPSKPSELSNSYQLEEMKQLQNVEMRNQLAKQNYNNVVTQSLQKVKEKEENKKLMEQNVKEKEKTLDYYQKMREEFIRTKGQIPYKTSFQEAKNQLIKYKNDLENANVEMKLQTNIPEIKDSLSSVEKKQQIAENNYIDSKSKINALQLLDQMNIKEKKIENELLTNLKQSEKNALNQKNEIIQLYENKKKEVPKEKINQINIELKNKINQINENVEREKENIQTKFNIKKENLKNESNTKMIKNIQDAKNKLLMASTLLMNIRKNASLIKKNEDQKLKNIQKESQKTIEKIKSKQDIFVPPKVQEKDFDFLKNVDENKKNSILPKIEQIKKELPPRESVDKKILPKYDVLVQILKIVLDKLFSPKK